MLEQFAAQRGWFEAGGVGGAAGALLRDMINWCIEHPVRGKALDSDDPKLRAVEAHILAQPKGKALDYGKH